MSPEASATVRMAAPKTPANAGGTGHRGPEAAVATAPAATVTGTASAKAPNTATAAREGSDGPGRAAAARLPARPAELSHSVAAGRLQRSPSAAPSALPRRSAASLSSRPPYAPPPPAMPEAGGARAMAPTAATDGTPDARTPLHIANTRASSIPAPPAIAAATPRAAKAAPTLRAVGREGLVARPSSHATATATTRPVLRQRSSRRPVASSRAREAAQAAQTAFAQGPAETPAIHGSAERLAAASGGTLMREPTGEATVVFPDRREAASPVPTAAATRRGGAAPTATEPPATEPPAVPAVTGRTQRTTRAEAEHGREEWREDLYDYVLERLRRDLLHERERNGHLVDDLF